MATTHTFPIDRYSWTNPPQLPLNFRITPTNPLNWDHRSGKGQNLVLTPLGDDILIGINGINETILSKRFVTYTKLGRPLLQHILYDSTKILIKYIWPLNNHSNAPSQLQERWQVRFGDTSDLKQALEILRPYFVMDVPKIQGEPSLQSHQDHRSTRSAKRKRTPPDIDETQTSQSQSASLIEPLSQCTVVERNPSCDSHLPKAPCSTNPRRSPPSSQVANDVDAYSRSETWQETVTSLIPPIQPPLSQPVVEASPLISLSPPLIEPHIAAPADAPVMTRAGSTEIKTQPPYMSDEADIDGPETDLKCRFPPISSTPSRASLMKVDEIAALTSTGSTLGQDSLPESRDGSETRRQRSGLDISGLYGIPPADLEALVGGVLRERGFQALCEGVAEIISNRQISSYPDRSRFEPQHQPYQSQYQYQRLAFQPQPINATQFQGWPTPQPIYQNYPIETNSFGNSTQANLQDHQEASDDDFEAEMQGHSRNA